jgi:lipopolysaccharide transport protein LptA
MSEKPRKPMKEILMLFLGTLLAASLFADGVPAEKENKSGAGESVAQTESRAKKSKRPAKISSRSTYYDRKEGIGVFTGKVHVDDEEYQMHADKVYLFMKGTNELDRIVAVGNVAMTNDTKRAYGAKVSYYRNPGLVVLYSGDGCKIAAVTADTDTAGKTCLFDAYTCNSSCALYRSGCTLIHHFEKGL